MLDRRHWHGISLLLSCSAKLADGLYFDRAAVRGFVRLIPSNADATSVASLNSLANDASLSMLPASHWTVDDFTFWLSSWLRLKADTKQWTVDYSHQAVLSGPQVVRFCIDPREMLIILSSGVVCMNTLICIKLINEQLRNWLRMMNDFMR